MVSTGINNNNIENKPIIFYFVSDIMSLAGSKASARSVSPGGSTIAFSDRLSLASGSIPGILQETSLSPQQLGAMGN